MKLKVPDKSLIVLIGASGSGKSSFARQHFLPTEIVSSDTCRGLVSDDENYQEATNDAFELLHFTVEMRLKRGKLTVVDATNVQAPSRRALIEIARTYHMLPVALAFNMPEALCHDRNALRPDRQFGSHVVKHQTRDLRQSLKWLRKEGFRHVHILGSQAEVDAAEIQRERLFNDRRDEAGPFDIVGDVHGCYRELVQLLGKLGYSVGAKSHTATPPEGRRLVFVGDLVDRGPDSVGVLKLAMNMVEAGSAIAVPGNHDVKLVRHLFGGNVNPTHGLDLTIAQLAKESEEFRDRVGRFLDGLISHFVFDDGKLVVAHAGMVESMQGRGSGRVREFALYGETTGEMDEFGLPIRYKWAEDYRGKALVAYGHTPVPNVEFLNNTICLDTGCVFGGKLSALRYPELEVVSVEAEKVHAEPVRPLVTTYDSLSGQHASDDVLDVDQLRKRMHVVTRNGGTIIIPEENTVTALEVMSRFAVNPKWLVYLPPTMSPSDTSREPGFLEHPAESFNYYRDAGVEQVICEEKHMGSRAVVVLCKDESVARTRFGVIDEGIGVIVTRTGRQFFTEEEMEQALLGRVSSAMQTSGLWDELNSDWVVLDCELLPWSAKAQELLRRQYAPVGAAGMAGLAATNKALALASARLEAPELSTMVESFGERQRSVEAYIAAYRQYCWNVTSLEDYKLAPFHVLASEGAVHHDKSHVWHMDLAHRLAASDLAIMRQTPFVLVDVNHEASIASATEWWLEMTGKGGEGMVVKPIDFLANGPKGLVQPAVKCRGREYLRIIYGPEYLAPGNLDRLRRRGLARKRRLAQREFLLGMEGLHRFVDRQPLRNVHECVFAVLALESEAVDPRL